MKIFIYCLSLLVQIPLYLAGQRCGYPAVPPHAIIDLMMDSENITRAKYKCAEPFLMIGNDTRSCDAKLFAGWQGEIPVCALNVAYRKPLLHIHLNQEELIGNDGSPRTCLFPINTEDYEWRIDLLNEFNIKAVHLWTKEDSVSVTITYYSSNDEEVFPRVQSYQQETKSIPEDNDIIRTRHLYLFSSILKFRYMDISLNTSLCEVQVFSADHKEILSPSCCHHSVMAKQVRIFENICYYIHFIKDGLTWSEAESKCKSMQGHLVTVPNFNVHTFLRWELLHTTWNIGSFSDHKLIWIDAYKNNSQTTWGWWNKSHVSSLWNEMSFKNQDNNCISMSSEVYYSWRVWPCENKQVKLFICQQNPINCGTPQQQEHSYILTLPEKYYFKVKEIANYKCEDGYHMQNTDNRDRECLASGQWSGQAPYCILSDDAQEPSSLVIPIVFLCAVVVAGIVIWRFWVKRSRLLWFPSFKWVRPVSNTYISAPALDIPETMITANELNQSESDSYEDIPTEIIEITHQSDDETTYPN